MLGSTLFDISLSVSRMYEAHSGIICCLVPTGGPICNYGFLKTIFRKNRFFLFFFVNFKGTEGGVE
jgi:hypothetical protein